MNDGGFRTTQFSLEKWLEASKALIFGNRVGAIRTRDLPLRRRLLYPTELQPRVVVILHPDVDCLQGPRTLHFEVFILTRKRAQLGCCALLGAMNAANIAALVDALLDRYRTGAHVQSLFLTVAANNNR